MDRRHRWFPVCGLNWPGGSSGKQSYWLEVTSCNRLFDVTRFLAGKASLFCLNNYTNAKIAFVSSQGSFGCSLF